MFYLNRLQFVGRKKQGKEESFSFQPKISRTTETIAKKYREKVAESINEPKISKYDWLSATGHKDVWRKNARNILKEEEMKNCTFKPNVSSYNIEPPSSRSMRADSKHRSKDLMPKTNNKCNDLYELSKRLQAKPKEDKTTDERDYERNKKECTFAPN